MNNKSLVVGIVLGALAVFLILLLSGSWGGMMGPGWGMMGPGMMWGFAPLGMIALLAIVFIPAIVTLLLAIWVIENLGKRR